MGFNLTVEGQEKLTYNKDIISHVQAGLSSQGNARAKSSDRYMTVILSGKLHADSDGVNSETVKLFQWAQVPAEQGDAAYRKVTVQVEDAPKRSITLDKAFVVDYNESYSTQAGVGTFNLILRQKTDNIDDVKVTSDPGTASGAGASDGAENQNATGATTPAGDQQAATSDPIAAGGLNQTGLSSALGGATNGGLQAIGRTAVLEATNNADPSGLTGELLSATQAGGATQVMQGLEQTAGTTIADKLIPANQTSQALGGFTSSADSSVIKQAVSPGTASEFLGHAVPTGHSGEVLESFNQSAGANVINQAVSPNTASEFLGHAVPTGHSGEVLESFNQSAGTNVINQAGHSGTASEFLGNAVPAGHSGEVLESFNQSANSATGTAAGTLSSAAAGGVLRSVGRAAVLAAANHTGSAGRLAGQVINQTQTGAGGTLLHNVEQTVVSENLKKVDSTGITAAVVQNSLNKDQA